MASSVRPFKQSPSPPHIPLIRRIDNKVVFCTGGNGTICSAQVRALVHLGANACIVGRNVEKTEGMAKDLMTARPGSKVIGIGSVDVRSPESLQKAVNTCVQELGAIDFLMYVTIPLACPDQANRIICIVAAQQATSSPRSLNSLPTPSKP